MISVRFIPREEWEAELRRYGCEPLAGLTPLNTAEWWRWPWRPSPPFTVPVDELGRCDAVSWHRLLADLAKYAPPDWQFPED